MREVSSSIPVGILGDSGFRRPVPGKLASAHALRDALKLGHERQKSSELGSLTDKTEWIISIPSGSLCVLAGEAVENCMRSLAEGGS